MTIPAHIAAHLEEARKAQTKWMHDLWTELAEDDLGVSLEGSENDDNAQACFDAALSTLDSRLDALRAYPTTQATESEGNA